jgi:hypothetical protein
MIELIPYNRDYKSSSAVKASFDAGQDFQGDYSQGFRLFNKPQIPIGTWVLLRYKNNTQVTTTEVTTHTLVLDPITICKQARTEILDTDPFDVGAYRCINAVISHIRAKGRPWSEPGFSSVDSILHRHRS